MEKWRNGEGIGIGGGGRQQKERPIAHEAAGALDNDASSRQNMATDSSSSKEEDRDADVGHELSSLLLLPLPPGRKLQFITSSLVGASVCDLQFKWHWGLLSVCCCCCFSLCVACLPACSNGKYRGEREDESAMFCSLVLY